MDYKKKYENALEWARQVINGECGFIRKEVEEVFPELKESDDERIRKDVLAFIRRKGQHIDKYKWHKWIAWLEKQGKYKTIWEPTKEQLEALEHFVRSVRESGYASPYDNNTKLLYSLLTDLQVLEKQGKQKSAWSEEDEERYKSCIKRLGTGNKEQPDTINTVWLKSLKNRIQPRQKWDSADELHALSIKQVIKCGSMLGVYPEKLEELDKWLESLKQRLQ